MKLQKKTLLVFVILLISVLVVISIFFSTILLASYSALEEQYIEKDLAQAVSKLDDEFFTMSSIASDWGPWDDTVDFVNGNDTEYLNSNLQPYGFDNLNLNLIVLTNTKGEVLFSGAYDLENKVMAPVPAFFSGKLDLNNPLMNMSDPHQVTTGVLMLPDDPMLVVSQPIVHSDFSGPPQGVVIMGRYLSREEIARLAKLTQPSLAFTRTDSPVLTPDLLSHIRENRGSAPGIIRQLNGNEIAGYALIPDIYGNDALVLQITEARDIYHQGLNTTMQVLLIIILSGVFLGLVVIILLDRFLLERMNSLAIQVYTIGKSGSTTEHVTIEGDDELSGLAAEINRMLDTIEQTQSKVQASEARFRGLAENLPLVIFEMDTIGRLLYVNKTGVEIFGITEEKIAQGINIRQYLSPDNIEQMQRGLSAVMSGLKSPGEIYTLTQLDGNLMRAIVSTSLIYREGSVTGFRGIVIDITERIRLEEALTESEGDLQSLIWSIRVGIIVIDVETHRIIDVNPAALEMIGATKDAVINKLCHNVICPAEMGRCPITDLNQTVDNAERTLLTPDGRKISIIKYVVPVMLHGKPCLLETFIDNSYRKQIELKLAESEEKYRFLIENSHNIIYMLTLEGVFTFVSQSWTALLGQPVSEVVGRAFGQFVHPDDIAGCLAFMQSKIETGQELTGVEYRVQHADGSWRWHTSNLVLLKDESGTTVAFEGSATDITKRKLAEEALRESEQRFDQLAEQSGTIAWEVDASGLYIYVSHVSEAVWGYRPDELVGRMHFYDLHPESGREEFRTVAFAFFGRKESFWNLENVVQAKDGHQVNVSTNGIPILNPDGTLRGYRGSDTDITERKKIEDALVESEGKYRALTENTRDILFSIDMANIFTYVSPQINKYGFLAEEIIGKSLRDVIHPEDIVRVEDDLSRDLEKGARFHSTFRILDKWGNIHWFDEEGTLRLDQYGMPIGIYGVLRDDSERKRAEDAIELANKKLNLMNNITRHDILNTITGLLGCVDMASATSSPEEKTQLLDDIRDLTRIIQRQIAFTREYQEVGVHLPLWQNVHGVIGKVLQNFEKTGIHFEIDPGNMEIYADPLLEKVFYNLVDNATRYGETITTIRISTQTSGNHALLIFEDDGAGIPVDQKTRVFERGVGRNTGMGLFLTREILAITGISIRENGVPGKGARFELLVPWGTFRSGSDTLPMG